MSVTTETKPITSTEAIDVAKDWTDAEFVIRKIEADIAQKQAAVAARYDADLEEARTKQSEAKMKLEVYLEANRAELFTGKSKSTQVGGITLGVKLKPASLLLKKAKDSWENVLARLKDAGTTGRKFIKKSESVDKTALKKADAEFLKEMGVCVEQAEEFYVKL